MPREAKESLTNFERLACCDRDTKVKLAQALCRIVRAQLETEQEDADQ
jgi:hypothetical protein